MLLLSRIARHLLRTVRLLMRTLCLSHRGEKHSDRMLIRIMRTPSRLISILKGMRRIGIKIRWVRRRILKVPKSLVRILLWKAQVLVSISSVLATNLWPSMNVWMKKPPGSAQRRSLSSHPLAKSTTLAGGRAKTDPAWKSP